MKCTECAVWSPLSYPDPWVGQYSFQGLMIVIAAWFIPLSPLFIVSMVTVQECSQWLGKILCKLLVKKHSGKACVNAPATAIIFIMALNIIKSVNQSRHSPRYSIKWSNSDLYSYKYQPAWKFHFSYKAGQGFGYRQNSFHRKMSNHIFPSNVL